MKEYDWFDSIIRHKIRQGKIKNELKLNEFIDDFQTKGLSDKNADKLYKKYKNVDFHIKKRWRL